MTQIEVNEMLRFVGHVRPEVATHNAVPRGIVLLIELWRGDDVGSSACSDGVPPSPVEPCPV